MRCPELYPPSPQMTPVTSAASTPGKIMRFSTQRPSPLASSAASSRYICNSSSDDSDAEDPPPYPGQTSGTDGRSLQQTNQLLNSNNYSQSRDLQTVSSNDDIDCPLSEHPGSMSSVSTTTDQCSDLGTHSSQQDNEHLSEILESTEESGDNTQTSEQLSDAADSQGECLCDIVEHNGRERLDTQSSIIGTVV